MSKNFKELNKDKRCTNCGRAFKPDRPNYAFCITCYQPKYYGNIKFVEEEIKLKDDYYE